MAASNSSASGRVPSLMVARIVWSMLVLGVVAFLAVALFLTTAGREDDAASGNVLFWVAVGMLAVNLPLSFVLRAMIHRRARGADDRIAPGPWFQGHIVSWALVEGAALFGATVTLLSPDKWPAALVPAVGVAALLAGFPSGSDLEGGPDAP
jgi:hypothetical protein